MTPPAAITHERDGRADLARAAADLRSGQQASLAVGAVTVVLDRDTADQVLALLTAAEEGRRARVGVQRDELTTGQVADVLGVSRPTVVALIDSGQLPARRLGTHRRVRSEDVDSLLATRRATRAEHLGEVARLSAELGLTTADAPPVK